MDTATLLKKYQKTSALCKRYAIMCLIKNGLVTMEKIKVSILSSCISRELFNASVLKEKFDINCYALFME